MAPGRHSLDVPGAGHARAIVAGVGAQIAGVIWILQWAHALVAHGPTQYNAKQLWLGMTWMDSTKFLIVAYLLLIPGVLYMERAPAARGDKLVSTFGTMTIMALIIAAVGTAMEFRLFEWGTYSGTFESTDSIMWAGGPLRAVASAVVLTLGFGVLGVRVARHRAIPYWLVPILMVGSMSTVFIGGPLPPVPSLTWLAFGGWLLTRAHADGRRTSRERPHDDVLTPAR